MKKILFMLGNYTPKASANGICVRAVIEDLKRKGYHVYVICYGNEEKMQETEQETIVTVQSNRCLDNDLYSGKTRGIKRKVFILWSLLTEPPYPMIGKKMAAAFQKKLKFILSRYEIDTIVAVVHPVDAALALASLGKEPLCRRVIYELDTLTDDQYLKTGWRRFFFQKIKKTEERIHSRADKIVYMRSHDASFSSAPNASEVKYVAADIPLIDQAYYDEIHRERQPKHSIPDPFIVYAGSLSAQIRPPEYVLSLLGALYQKKVRYKACFYSRGCSEVVRDYSDKTASQIEWKDYVSPDELLSIYHDAHFLLNIGNLAEDVLPSKLIQYISTGKPIIHISFSQKDACLPYLERYENCVIINTEEPFEENVSKLTSFLRTNQSRVLDYSVIARAFQENTVEWTSHQLLN
ncbi:MAG: hypothetical protein IKE58_11450 [Blautia sp.]|nr:hypothetical protein [Blautia sp.]